MHEIPFIKIDPKNKEIGIMIKMWKFIYKKKHFKITHWQNDNTQSVYKQTNKHNVWLFDFGIRLAP